MSVQKTKDELQLERNLDRLEELLPSARAILADTWRWVPAASGDAVKDRPVAAKGNDRRRRGRA
jgi:hypothetical protein